MKSRKQWEKEAGEQYSRMYATASNVLETKKTIQSTYGEIQKKMADIHKMLHEDRKQGQRIIKLKRYFWSRAETDTISGHMKTLGGKLKRKFSDDTKTLSDQTASCLIEFDHRLLGEFLEIHGIKARKMNRAEREIRYEELVAGDPSLKPRFYNLRRNLMAMVNELLNASKPGD